MIGSFEARLAQRGLYRTREGRFVESAFIAQQIPTDPPDLSPNLLVGIARHRGSSAVEQPRRGERQGVVGLCPVANLNRVVGEEFLAPQPVVAGCRAKLGPELLEPDLLETDLLEPDLLEPELAGSIAQFPVAIGLVAAPNSLKRMWRMELQGGSFVLREMAEWVPVLGSSCAAPRPDGVGEARRGRDSSVEAPSFPSIGPRQSSLRAHAGTRRRRSRQRDAFVADHPG